MSGIKGLSKIQIGRESTSGTAVAADTIWRSEFAGLSDDRETTFVPEQLGIVMPSNRSYVASLAASLSMPAAPLTPEQFVHILEAAIKQVETGTADGATSSGFTHTYAVGSTSVNTLSTYTIETGDNQQAEEAEFCFVEQFTITGNARETLMASANWIGRQVANASFTGSLTAPTVSHLHASTGSLWIDDNDGSFGTTAVSSGNIRSFSLTVDTGWRASWTIDSGELYFQGIYFDQDSFNAELQITFEHDSTVVTEKGKWRSSDVRLYRLEFTGDDYGTAGTGTEFSGKKGLRIDIPGSYVSFDALSFEDGKSVSSATLQGGYDETSGEVLSIMVANETENTP